MIEGLILAGIAWWLIKDQPDRDQDQDQDNDQDQDDLLGVYTWEQGYSNEDPDSVVWKFNKENLVYWVIGNLDHSSFVRSTSQIGTINIPASQSGGSSDMVNVQVFSGQDTAADKLDDMWWIANNPDPTGPSQPEPDDDDDDDDGSTQPDYSGGGVPTFGGSQKPTTGSGQFQNAGASDLGVNMFGN